MRLLPIQMCRAGMRLGKNIFNEEGLILLKENVELSDKLITRLMRYGIDNVYIQDPRTDDIEIQDVISDETRNFAVKQIRSTFRRLMDDPTRKTTHQHHLGKDFRNLITLVIDDISKNKDAMIMLTQMHQTDHYLYQHSLNVCVYATMLGISAGYTEDKLMVLGLGAVLHDIGKVRVPIDILNKPSKLTQEEFIVIKKHADWGYKLLKDEPNIPLIAAHCAFQHHERWDGSGYPRGIAGDDIHEFARWIGLVDSYDAMTTHRCYRPTLLPHQAMEMLFIGSGILFEQDKIALFRDKVAIYPLGITVGLSTGETGVVVDINTKTPHRPVVRILQDADGQELTVPYEVDLSKQLSLMISNVNQVKIEQMI
jgi:HD-GYP domain-containing protein (c-di-GMP phosphodiesterase class II)